MTFEHPQLGQVAPLSEDWRARKTWRHFHSPTERWSALAGVDTDRLRNAAPTRGCPPWRGVGGYPTLKRACDVHLRQEHDAKWVAVYERELTRQGTRCGPSRREDDAFALVSPAGVFAVASSGPHRHLLTVFRPHPHGVSVVLPEPPRAEHAWHYWEQETGMKVPNRREQLSRELLDAGDVWLLARAVAACDGSAEEGVAAARERARQRLSAVDPALRAQATPVAEKLVDRLDGALEQSDAVDALLEIEDALAVLEVLSGPVVAEAVLNELRILLEWAPETWSAVVPIASARAVETTGVAATFWEAVEESVGAAMVHASADARLEPATLVERVLPAAWWAPWATRLRSVSAVARQLTELPGLRIGVAHLGVGTEDPWEVHGPPEWAMPGTRVFVVDETFFAGHEVTREARNGEALWGLELPGQRAQVVVVRGVVGDSLEELLSAAATSPGATVEHVEVSRPS